MTNITTDNVRRLDALNLIEATAKDDRDTAVGIMAMYAEADYFDDPHAYRDLARCLAFTAAALYRQLPPETRDRVFATARAYMLSDEAQEGDR
jgi:hypothetical protein